MSAVGGFFSGLRQGIDTGQSVRRNRKIEEVIDRQLDEYDLERSGKYDQYINEGGNPNDFPEFNESEDPFLIRGFNWLKERFGGGRSSNPEDAFVASSTATRMPQAGVMMSADGGPVRKGIPSYADGGTVEDDENLLGKVGAGAAAAYASSPAIRRGAYKAGSALGRAGGKALRAAGGAAKRVAPIAGAVALVDQLDEDYDERIARRFGFEGPNPADGDPSLAGFAKFLGKRALGYASDLGNVLTFGQADRLYRDHESEPGISAQPAQAPTEPSRSALPADKEAAAEAGGSKEQPSEEIAANAMQAGVANTPGHPDNPDQDFNWAEVADAGATPDEIPHVGVQDWVEYRKNYVLASIKQGKSPQEAHQEVNQIQTQGMLSNLRQAGYLLRAGNGKAAALAARAAYQYFPNGADVRFGIHQTESGPVLVGMGVDEVTGEPIKEGKPMFLTPDLIDVMATNFEKPGALQVWTKDMHDAAFRDREYNEVTKPTAQSETIARDRTSRAALMQGEAAMDRAAASLFGSNGMSQNEFMSSFDRIADDLGLTPDVEVEDIPRLRTMATRLRQRYPDQGTLSDEQIVEYVLNAYMSGDMSEIAQLLEQ